MNQYHIPYIAQPVKLSRSVHASSVSSDTRHDTTAFWAGTFAYCIDAPDFIAAGSTMNVWGTDLGRTARRED